MRQVIPDGKLSEELHGHELKLLAGAAGATLLAAGVATRTDSFLAIGTAFMAVSIGQLASYWGTATARIDGEAERTRVVGAEVAQKLTKEERTGFNGYATGRPLEDLAGDDTVFVLHVGEPPSRIDRWLPWRETRPQSEWAPVVVMDRDRAVDIDEGDRRQWELAPTTLDGVYVPEYRGESAP